MFVAQGIKSVRMDDVAQHLGISKRTLYELFGDKEELLYAALKRYSLCTHAHWEELCAGATNVLEGLFMVLGAIMEKAEVSSRIINNLRKFHPAVYDRLVNEEQYKRHETLRSMVEQGIAEGLFINSMNIDLAIALLHYTASGLMTNIELIQPADMTRGEVFAQIITTFFRGISTPEGHKLIDEQLRRFQIAK